MSDERLPGSNPEAPYGIELRVLDQEVVKNQFTKRAKICMGEYQLSDLEYGIIAGSDPAAPASNGAFLVEQSVGNAIRFDVQPGRAFTRSGFLVELETEIDGKALAVTTTGVLNVVFLAYQTRETTDPEKLVVTRSSTVAGIEFEVVDAETLVRVDTLENYLDAGLYPDSDKQHHVVLAIIKVTEDSVGAKSLIIDHSRTSYSWNRPWFSHVDMRHRVQVGTGTVSNNNPHGLGLSDIGQGNMTLLQALVRTGTILTKDYDVDRVPGFLCREVITPARRLVDTSTGTHTGVPDAVYVELLDTPIHLGRSRSLDNPAPPDYHDFAPWLIKGTNRLVFHPDENIGAVDIEVWYMSAGGSMKTEAVPDILTITQLDPAREWCVTGGQAVTEFANTALDLRDYRPFPYLLRAFVKADGSVVCIPQAIQCNHLLRTVNASVGIAVDLLGPSRIVVALTNSLSPPLATMDIQIQVVGTDSGGNVITETLTFDEDWRNFAAPSVPGALGGESSDTGTYMRVPTTQIFYTVTGWSLLANTDSSPEASIGIFAHPDWRLSPNMRDLCCLGAIAWDGLRVNSIMDFRRSRMTLHDPGEVMTQAEIAARVGLQHGIMGGVLALPAFVPSAYNPNEQEILVEDFNRPRYHGLKLQRNADWFQLVSGGEARENVNLAHDRWADGLGTLTFDYPSTAEGRPQYISRAMRFPIFGATGAGGGYSGLMKIVLVRHYTENQGLLGGASNSIANNANKRTIVSVRFGATNIAADAWSAWYSFTVAGDVDGRDVNTFLLQTGVPEDEFFTKMQFWVTGGNLRALAFHFDEPVAREVVFEELVFRVSARFSDLQAAEGGGGFLSATVIKPNPRITVPYIGAMNNDSGVQFMVQDLAQNFWIAGVYLMVFNFDGAPLPDNDYTVEVTANTGWDVGDENVPIAYSSAVQRGTWEFFQAAGGPGRVAITFQSDSDGATTALRWQSLGNFVNFTVTIRVPV